MKINTFNNTYNITSYKTSPLAFKGTNIINDKNKKDEDKKTKYTILGALTAVGLMTWAAWDMISEFVVNKISKSSLSSEIKHPEVKIEFDNMAEQAAGLINKTAKKLHK